MKTIVTIAAIILALLIRSEIVSLLLIIAGLFLFLGKVVNANEHESW